ncbi:MULTISPECIES: ATP-binding protein [Staphylococcus]|uniref:ATP-binding protein n=1 Tax=Staphylococcus TaxID=1279 RepID=UPI001951EAFA|nr:MULTISPECIES: ATP-binding protein [Staphylococcus]MCT2554032.1 ATP-binding protein [Staphylococcus aureus]MCT2554814.1 ATP-binding protein [Staphylococcus aureus]MCT2569132.1 ATP-binding protein [Staphylococcus aureus]MCT2570277.1 ATP-binding protein [Staphylococcus aureus]MCT2574251.1 ATP-binding protein [Staphylococcus aureus]
MDLKAPYAGIKNNLLLTKNGEVWAYYRIRSESISTANYDAKEASKKRMKYFLESIKGYQDFHFEMYEHDLDLRNKFKEISKDFDDTTFDVANYYAQETIDVLEQELQMITHNSFVMGVKLRELSDDAVSIKEMVKSTLSDTAERMISNLGFNVSLDDKVLSRYESFERELADNFLSIEGERLTENELAYIVRKPFISNATHDVQEESARRAVTDVCNVVIDPTQMRVLKVTNENETFYTTTVVVDDFPLDMEYTHIFEKAQNMPFPVECHIKAKIVENDKVKKKFDRAKINHKAQSREKQATGDNASEEIQDNLFVLEQMEKEVTGSGVFMEWSCLFVIKSDDLRDCKRKAKRLVKRLKETEIYAVNPLADQLQLYYQVLHGNDLFINKYWVQRTTATGIAENLFGVSQSLGTKTGFYIGRIDKFIRSVSREEAVASSRDIILFSLLLAAKGIKGAVSDSPHVLITGQTGKGKSFLAKLLWLYTSFFKGQMIYWDPKSEFADWFNKITESEEMRRKYPLFVSHLERFKYVTLDYNKSNNFGCLDPIVFLNGIEANEMLKSVFDEIKSFENYHHIETAIHQAISDTIDERENGETVGSLSVIEKLQNHDDEAVRNAGDLLYQKTQNNILKLVFGNGENPALNIEEKITILQVKGLDIPKADDDPSTYSTSEQNGITLMLLIGKFLQKFGSRRQIQTTIFIDEGWAFSASRQGKKVAKGIKRMGRSENNSLVFITQSVKDKADEDGGNFGCHFAFDEKDEREDILKSLDLEYSKESPENMEMLKDLKKGQCIFSDFYGRVGKMAVHCPFEEMTEAFRTQEDSASSKAEEKFAI